MGIVYHGSSIHKLKKIKKNNNSSKDYVYATDNKILAIINSHSAGSEFTYSLNRSKDGKVLQLIERIPNAFDVMYNTSSSIYILDSSNFEKVRGTTDEYRSKYDENVLAEEFYPNLLDVLINLDKSKAIKIYRYPSKPLGFPRDNSDLINKLALNADKDTIRKRYITLLGFFPELLNKVNDKLFSIDKLMPGFSTEDLFKIINYCIEKNNLDSTSELYLRQKLDKFTKLYPIYFKDIDLLKKNIKKTV